MPKLLYITTNLQGSGGVARVLSVKLDYLIERYGYTIHVITTNNTSDTFFYKFNKKIVFHKIDIKNFGFQHVLKYKNKLRGIVDNINPNIIINTDNGLKGSMFPLLLKTNIPIVYENHNDRYLRSLSLKDNLKHLFSSLFFLLSKKKYKCIVLLNRKANKKAKNVKTIPNPLCFGIPKKRASLKNEVVIAVGRFSYQKGYDILFKIWRIVVKSHPEWQLHIYGEGNTLKLEKLAVEYEIIDNITIVQPVKNIEFVYNNSSMLLNTSRYEPFGLAIIEAMSFGLPVLAFDNTLGPKSYIINNKNGFLIPKNNIDEYAEKVSYLIKNYDERVRIGEEAVKSIKKFDIDEVMKQWHELFTSLK